MEHLFRKPQWYILDSRLDTVIGPFETEEKAKTYRKEQLNNSEYTEIQQPMHKDDFASFMEERERYKKKT